MENLTREIAYPAMGGRGGNGGAFRDPELSCPQPMPELAIKERAD